MLTQNCSTAIKAAILQKLKFRVKYTKIGIKAARLLRSNKCRLNDIKEITWGQVTREEKGWIKSPRMSLASPSENKASIVLHNSLLTLLESASRYTSRKACAAAGRRHTPTFLTRGASLPSPWGDDRTKLKTKHFPARLSHTRNFSVKGAAC